MVHEDPTCSHLGKLLARGDRHHSADEIACANLDKNSYSFNFLLPLALILCSSGVLHFTIYVWLLGLVIPPGAPFPTGGRQLTSVVATTMGAHVSFAADFQLPAFHVLSDTFQGADQQKISKCALQPGVNMIICTSILAILALNICTFDVFMYV